MTGKTTITVSCELNEFLDWCKDRSGLDSFDALLRECAQPMREKANLLELERSRRIFWGLDEPHRGQAHTE